ncbi:MAG: metallophosphoesterase [Caulobacterales bacterium]|nr:metallophosphoesterase [Caulobacterales bacterium]
MDIAHALMAAAWAGAVLGPVVAWWAWSRLGPQRPRVRLTGLVLFASLYVLGVWAFLIEPETLVVRHVRIESPAWRGPPLRIGVLSDTHVGAPHMSARRLGQVVARLTQEDPDLVVFLGDYVGGRERAGARSAAERQEIADGIAALSGARARLGRYAILGNHDWWYDGKGVETALWKAGAPVLDNYAQRIARPEGAFWVAGLADYASPRSQPSAAQALAAVPAAEPVILLSHWPDAWPQVPARVALTLAGHSHCGQVNLPILGRLIAASPGAGRWPCGRYDEAGRILYVTGGLGVSILPVRFRAPPEIVIVSLRGRP